MYDMLLGTFTVLVPCSAPHRALLDAFSVIRRVNTCYQKFWYGVLSEISKLNAPM